MSKAEQISPEIGEPSVKKVKTGEEAVTAHPSIHSISAMKLETGEVESLGVYRGRLVLVENTASL